MAESIGHFAGSGGSEGVCMEEGGGEMQAVTAAGAELALPRVGKRGAPQAFARKLFEILTTESTSVIAWNTQGTAFHVKDVDTFSEQTLTKYYRHSKFSSFQRQLNLYSFRKIVKGPDTGGYAHPMFHRDRPADLYLVRRSISGTTSNSTTTKHTTNAGTHAASVVTGAAFPTASRAKANAAAARRGVSVRADGPDWDSRKAYKSAASARRTGKLRHRSKPRPKFHNIGDKKAMRMVDGQQVVGDGLSPAWTSGESSDDSLVSGDESDPELTQREGENNGATSDSDDNIGESSADGDSDSDSDSDDRQAEQRGQGRGVLPAEMSKKIVRKLAHTPEAAVTAPVTGDGLFSKRRELSLSNLFPKRFSCAAAAQHAGGNVEGSGGTDGAGRGKEDGAGGAEVTAAVEGDKTSHRSSPFGSFFKQTFSGRFTFMEKPHRRTLSPLSVDMTGAEPTAASTAMPTIDIENASAVAAGASALEHNTPSTPGRHSASDNIAPPVAEGGDGEEVIGLGEGPCTDKDAADSTGGGPKVPAGWRGPRITLGKDSATGAAVDAVTMPPPPRREQREELGLVEQLTNMVEVFDICDLLRRVSTSGRPLDKDGKASGSFNSRSGSSQHLRQMSVDTDAGVTPSSPQDSQGLPSLASMELMRDSSRDWDTLMAGSADVSDIGNTMVQSVAEFFSF